MKACARTVCESICGVVMLILYITAALTGFTSTRTSDQHTKQRREDLIRTTNAKTWTEGIRKAVCGPGMVYLNPGILSVRTSEVGAGGPVYM